MIFDQKDLVLKVAPQPVDDAAGGIAEQRPGRAAQLLQDEAGVVERVWGGGEIEDTQGLDVNLGGSEKREEKKMVFKTRWIWEGDIERGCSSPFLKIMMFRES